MAGADEAATAAEAAPAADSTAADSEDRARAADRRFLELALDEGDHTGHVVIAMRHSTPDGRFYGGAGLALTIVAMEAATRRRVRWATAQFVSSARIGDDITIEVQVAAAGRSTSQLRVNGSVEGRTLFHALGATGLPHSELPGRAFPAMPAVPAPDACPPLDVPRAAGGSPGHFETEDVRDAGTESPMRAWIRLYDHDVARPAMLGYIADLVPLAVRRALDVRGAGASLDNTIRVGAPVRSPWVLLELEPDFTDAGYAHGTVRLWSQTGELVAVATQTATLRPFPPDPAAPSDSATAF